MWSGITVRKCILALCLLPAPAFAQYFAFNGQCSKGGQTEVTQGLPATATQPLSGGVPAVGTGVIGSYPSCLVTVYITGTLTLANPIFGNASGSQPQTNPFTANTDGSVLFFAASGGYDVTYSGAGMPAPFTITDVQLGASGGGGGGAVWGQITGTLANQTDLETALGLLAPINSPSFTGTPLTPTPPSVDSSNKIANTAWVNEQGFSTGAGNVSGPGSSVANDIAIFNSTNGKVIADSSIQISAVALLASPIFTGTPQGPTATNATNNAELATTAFVKNQSYCPTAGCTFTGAVSGLTASEVGLSNVTNNAQAFASIYPNNSPSAGYIPVGNSGGSSYVAQPLTGDCSLTATGVITCTKSNGVAFGTGAFAAIANYLPLAGGTMTGKLNTVAPSTAAGFNLAPGSAPSSPVNGDCWTTTTGLFCYINGSAVGPFGTGGGGLSGLTTNGGIYATSATTAATFTPPSTNGIYDVMYNITGGVTAPPAAVLVGLGGRAITGSTSTDLVAYSDNATSIDHDRGCANAVTETLPTATTLGNPYFTYSYQNACSYTDTISPTTWTINGQSSLSVFPSQQCRVKINPNSATDWLAYCASAAGIWSSLIAPTANLSMNLYQTLTSPFTTTFATGDFGASPLSPPSSIWQWNSNATSSTDNSFMVGITAGVSSYQNPFEVWVDNFAQLQVCNTDGSVHVGIVVVGSAITCANLSTAPVAKLWVLATTGAHDNAILYQASSSATGTMLAMNNATASGTGWNVMTACAGATGMNGLCGSGTQIFQVDGSGDLTAAGTVSGGASTFTTLTVKNGSSLGGTAYSYGAPSTTGGAAVVIPATTYTLTGSSTTANFQGQYTGASTFTDASAGTVTDAFDEFYSGPAAAAGSLTITRAHTLGIVDSTSASSSITGGLVVATTLGTSATSVGIGGGNINAGGTGTFGGAFSVAGQVTATEPTGSIWGSATGGAKGAGTINATGLYVNGSAVSTSGGGTPAYPLTITGGVSGGVVYGSSSTQLTVSPAGTVNVLMKWGGAATAPGNSSVTDNGTTIAATEPITTSYNGTASQSSLYVTGTPYTGGTTTTNFPLFNLGNGSAVTTWSANGTMKGIDAPSGFTGNLEDYHINGGASVFSINYLGEAIINQVAGTTTAVAINNTTAATSSTSQSSPYDVRTGTFWYNPEFDTSSPPVAAVSANDCWSHQVQETNGSNGASIYALLHNGSSPNCAGSPSASYLLAPFAESYGVQTNAISSASAPTVALQGSGTGGTWTYGIVACVGPVCAAVSGTTSQTGPTTLNTSNWMKVTWSVVTGADFYEVYRTASGGTPASLGDICKIPAGATLECDDKGLTGDATTAQAYNQTAQVYVGAGPAVGGGTGGGYFFTNGTAPSTVVSTASGVYGNATNTCFDIVNGIVDTGCAVAALTPSKLRSQILTANSSAITATTPGTTVWTWGALPVSQNFSFKCEILYNQQGTAVAGDGFAVQGATNAPTRLDAWGKIYTTDPASTTVTGSLGSAQNITSTTATSVVTATPGAITTVYQAELAGTIQVGASASTLNINAFTGNASDSITIQAGSYCTLMP